MENTLYAKIVDAIKQAMKAHDNAKRDCLRTVVSDIKNITVNAGKEITDDACMKVLQKSVKTHTDSIEQFAAAGRDDLASKEKIELDAINEFLPKMLDEDEVKKIVDAEIANLSGSLGRSLAKKDMGLVMKAISSSALAASIPMKIASKIASSILA